MKIYVVAFLSLFLSIQSLAEPVSPCAKDEYTQKQITENIAAGERIDIKNSDDAVVGAFDYDPETGDISDLYLCGSNSGYYYAEGNAYKGEVENIHSDEYDSAFEVDNFDMKKINLVVYAIYFTGHPDGADYEPFSADLYFAAPEPPAKKK